VRTIPFDKANGIHPEFRSYGGGIVKQADVVMLQYAQSMPTP